jgi:hypothetical protein
MDNKGCRIVDKEYCDFIFNIRQTMQIVQAQFEIMDGAIEKCSGIHPDNLIECIGAVNTAHGEILRFLELNIKLAKLVDEFRAYILAKNSNI